MQRAGATVAAICLVIHVTSYARAVRHEPVAGNDLACTQAAKALPWSSAVGRPLLSREGHSLVCAPKLQGFHDGCSGSVISPPCPQMQLLKVRRLDAHLHGAAHGLTGRAYSRYGRFQPSNNNSNRSAISSGWRLAMLAWPLFSSRINSAWGKCFFT